MLFRSANLIDGMEPNRERIKGHLENSLMLVTALSPAIGYEKSAVIAHNAHEKGITLKESAMALGLVSEEDYDRLVVPENMIKPRD